MKTKYLLCLGVICILAVQLASAQQARYYNLFNQTADSTNDLTAKMPSATTNQVVLSGVTNQFGSPTSATTITGSNIVINCYEYDKCGFTFSTTGATSSTNGGYGVLIYGSMSKGAVWDATPRWSFIATNVAPGGQTYSTNIALDLSGMDRIAFVFFNTETNGYQTNMISGVLLKGSKVMTRTSAD